jgi:putative transposase
MPEESRFVGAPSRANPHIGETLFAPEGAPTCGAKSFHGRDLRTGRWSGAHQAYLITTVTHERKRYFEDACCARALVNALKHSDAKKLSHTHAYVVMPDHLHWLMTLGNEPDLSDTVGRVKGESARRINTVLGRQGSPIWQHGFHDHALRHEEDTRDIARYVVANPLRAGLVDRIGDYPWWDAEWL